MKRMTLLLLGVLLVSLAPLSYAQEPGILYAQDFSGEAPGWALEPGWEITPDGTLHGVGHQWAHLEGQDFGTDWRLTFRLNLTRGRIHLNYLWWVLNASGRNFPLKPPVGSHGATHQELEH